MSDLFSQIFDLLWYQSWHFTLLFPLIWALTLVFGKRYPKFSYSLAALLMVRLLVPLKIELPLFAGQLDIPARMTSIELPAVIVTPQAALQVSFAQILGFLWLSIVLFLGLRWIIGEWRFRQSLLAGEVVSHPEIIPLSQDLDLDQIPEIIALPNLASPMTLGVWKAKIILPESWATWSPTALQTVLLHEMSHIKRRDTLTILMASIARVIFFFHPFVYWLENRMDLDRERICDEMAMEKLGIPRRQYGQELLNHIEASMRPNAHFSFSSGMFLNKHNVLKRFEYLMEERGATMLKLMTSQKIVLGFLIGAMIILSCTGETPDDTSALVSSSGDSDMEKEYSEQENSAEFVSYDEAPQPVGGYAAISSAIRYPELARKAGIQGTVIVQATIGKDGKVHDASVLRGIPDTGLDQAAVDAILATSWKPATLDGKSVSVKISVPIAFRLKTE